MIGVSIMVPDPAVLISYLIPDGCGLNVFVTNAKFSVNHQLILVKHDLSA